MTILAGSQVAMRPGHGGRKPRCQSLTDECPRILSIRRQMHAMLDRSRKQRERR